MDLLLVLLESAHHTKFGTIDWGPWSMDTVDWAIWNVEKECRTLRQHHFEDLDQEDQKGCPEVNATLIDALDRVKSLASAEQLRPVQEVQRQLSSYADQALQLYGAGACGFWEIVRLEREV